MNSKQYKKNVDWTINFDKDSTSKDQDTLTMLRAILKNLGVSIPHGNYKDVLTILATDEYMGWQSCTVKEAQENANSGVPVIGISYTNAVVVCPSTEDECVISPAIITLKEDTPAFSVSDFRFFANIRATTTYPTFTYCSNEYLTESQMQVNAQYILNYLRACGWTKNAICGMLGNMQIESTINPGLWESRNEGNLKGGFGLVQWTPATNYIDWATARHLPVANMNSELERILYELDNNLQYYKTSAYPLTFYQFSKSYASPGYLARAFMYNYERPDSASKREEERATDAVNWYNKLA